VKFEKVFALIFSNRSTLFYKSWIHHCSQILGTPLSARIRAVNLDWNGCTHLNHRGDHFRSVSAQYSRLLYV